MTYMGILTDCGRIGASLFSSDHTTLTAGSEGQISLFFFCWRGCNWGATVSIWSLSVSASLSSCQGGKCLAIGGLWCKRNKFSLQDQEVFKYGRIREWFLSQQLSHLYHERSSSRCCCCNPARCRPISGVDHCICPNWGLIDMVLSKACATVRQCAIERGHSLGEFGRSILFFPSSFYLVLPAGTDW